MKDIIKKTKVIMKKYQEEFPEIKVDEDYFPFKLTEELGECVQTYLMLTNRGRQKAKSKEEIRKLFEHELADVFGFLLLFADSQNVDLEKAIDEKWFSHLEK